MDLNGALDGHQTALGAGNGAADDQHVQLGVNLHNGQVLDSHLIHAHVAGADFALEDTGGIGRGAHGTSVTMDGAAAVAGGGALCTPALDDALITVALADTGDINEVASLEGVSLHNVADVQLGSVVQVEFAQVLLGRHASLVQVAHLALGQLLLSHVLVAQLNRIVAFLLGSLLLNDRAGSRLNDGDGDHVAVLVKNLGHAHFFADDCLHVYFLLLGYWSA